MILVKCLQLVPEHEDLIWAANYIDIVGGAILAFLLYWGQWTFRKQFEEIVTGNSYWSKCNARSNLTYISILIVFQSVPKVFLSVPLLFLMVGIQ
jgi:hypothetical protein